MPKISSRFIFLLTTLYVVGLIIFALYLENFQGLDPCPLCLLQRYVFIIMGFVAFIALLHNPEKLGIRLYGFINLLVSSAGIGLAGRHVWLELLPPNEVPACGPSLEIMLEYMPWSEILKKSILGSGDCAKIDWSLMSLSIADWSFLCFTFLFILNLLILFKPNKK